MSKYLLNIRFADQDTTFCRATSRLDFQVFKIFGMIGYPSFYLNDIWDFDLGKIRRHALAKYKGISAPPHRVV
jgi:hypothetical protein